MIKFTKVKKEMEKIGLKEFFSSDRTISNLPLQLFKSFEMPDLACLIIIQWVKCELACSIELIDRPIENASERINSGVNQLKSIIRSGNFEDTAIWYLCVNHFENVAREQWTQWLNQWPFYEKVMEYTSVFKTYQIFQIFLNNGALSNQLSIALSSRIMHNYSEVLEKTACMTLNLANHSDLKWIQRIASCHNLLIKELHQQEHSDDTIAAKFLLDLFKSIEEKMQLCVFDLPYVPLAQVCINQCDQIGTPQNIKIDSLDLFNLLKLDVLKYEILHLMNAMSNRLSLDFKKRAVTFFSNSCEDYQNLNARFQMLKRHIATPGLKKHLSTMTKLLSVDIKWHISIDDIKNDIISSLINKIPLEPKRLHAIALIRSLHGWKNQIEPPFIQWIKKQSLEQIKKQEELLRAYITTKEFEDISPYKFESSSIKQDLCNIMEELKSNAGQTPKTSPQL